MLLAMLSIIFDYEEVGELLVNWGSIRRVDEFYAQFFTRITFLVLRSTLIIGSFIGLIFRKKLIRIFRKTLRLLSWTLVKICSSWAYYSKKEKKILLFTSLSLLLLRFWFIEYWELYEDELFSYNYLVSKGFFTTLFYYPGPNNHVFYSLLCSLLYHTHLPEAWVMRLPSAIISTMFFYVCVYILTKNRSFIFSLGASLLMQLSYNLFLYSVLGRGYSLEIFLAVISFYSYLRYNETSNSNFRIIFILSSILGFFTIPVFLYPFSSILIFFLLDIKTNRKSLFVSTFLIFAGSVFCYLPIFMVSGIDSVIGNDWVKPIMFEIFITRLPTYVFEIQNWLWNLDSFGVLISIIFLSSIVIKFNKEKWFWNGIFAISAPFYLLLIHQVLPFARVWTYLIIPQSLGVSFIALQLGNNMLRIALVSLYLILQFYVFFL